MKKEKKGSPKQSVNVKDLHAKEDPKGGGKHIAGVKYENVQLKTSLK